MRYLSIENILSYILCQEKTEDLESVTMYLQQDQIIAHSERYCKRV